MCYVQNITILRPYSRRNFLLLSTHPPRQHCRDVEDVALAIEHGTLDADGSLLRSRASMWGSNVKRPTIPIEGLRLHGTIDPVS